MAERKERKVNTQARPGCFFCTIAAPQLEAMFGSMWPEDTREHFRSSRVEFLKGIRSLLDQRIASLSERPKKGARVAVE